VEPTDDHPSPADESESPRPWWPYPAILLLIIVICWVLGHWPKSSAPPAVSPPREVAGRAPSEVKHTLPSRTDLPSNPVLAPEPVTRTVPPIKVPPPVDLPPVDRSADANEQTEWLAQLNELSREYKVAMIWKDGAGAWPGLAFPNEDILAQYVPFFAAQLKRYPVSLLRSADVRRFVLCRNLPRDAQRRTLVADPATHTVQLDVAAGLRNHQDARLAIHHGIYRLLDAACGTTSDEQAWTALNSPGFQYRAGSPENADAAPQPPGFVSRYAKVAAADDRAEVFALWMANPEGLRTQGATDPIVAKKSQYVRGLVERACPGNSFLPPVHPSPEALAERKPAPSGQLPQTWPRYLRTLPGGEHEVRIRNPNPTPVKVGLRSKGDGTDVVAVLKNVEFRVNKGDGIDLDVPAGQTHSVRVPSGTYEMYFWYPNKPDEVLQGNDVPLLEPGRGVQITLVRTVGGNYGLRPVRK
jgi:hypothetical protein